MKDCSGKKHTNKFKIVCEKIGLGVQKVEKYGWATSPEYNSDEFNNRVERALTPLSEDEKYLLSHISSILPPEVAKKSRNLSVYICPGCGQKIRGKDKLNIICGDCNLRFEIQNEEEGEDN